ncbi:uncharacterized protein F54F2.9-like [Cimex lectularius]|uniref:DnaJ homolog subfamily C member 1 n=1 Tax=Cimex lectularius TaxID=79782 RepID=A0A8I6TIS6_CIMLE|nr:uncharacterized protein F54F2.9-like [Cimex lectularius]
MHLLTLITIVSSFTLSSVKCWDQEDIEVFDAVEEIRENFYELLGVSHTAEPDEIRKAFRQLSLKVHPDKSNHPDAETQFRNLVTVFEILKDQSKRTKYNDVLKNGLPDWKHPVYYYRRYKKMGLLELMLILFGIITIGQYLVAWASYLEKKYVLEEFVSIKSKKLQKRQKKGKMVDMEAIKVLPELVTNLPKPSVYCTLPVQICRLCWFLIVKAPPLVIHWIKEYSQRKEKEEEKEESSSEEEVYVPRERGPRRRKAFQIPEMKDSNNEIKIKDEPKAAPTKPTPVVSGGLWTDDDLLDLIRLMKKYPTGTQERWEKIGESMKRAPFEVAHMAHKMKDDGFKPPKKDDEESTVVEEPRKKMKTKGGKMAEDVEEGTWTQVQQKSLEQALAIYRKGTPGDRWENIAKAVPGKTKEECMQRYKYLADLVKKRKQNAEESS